MSTSAISIIIGRLYYAEQRSTSSMKVMIGKNRVELM